MNVEDIKLGDLVKVAGEEDCDYIVVDLPGWNVIDPYDYKCLDRNDGILGSVTPEKIIAVNGEPVRTVTPRRTLVELAAHVSAGGALPAVAVAKAFEVIEDARYAVVDGDEALAESLLDKPLVGLL